MARWTMFNIVKSCFLQWCTMQLLHVIVCVNRQSLLGYRLKYVHVLIDCYAK
jgi:hypothetical protein